MHAFEFLKAAPAKRALKPIYVILGEDAYLRDESLRSIARQAVGGPEIEMALARVAGDRAKLADVLDEVRTLPFLAKCRVVVVENADPFITANRKELETYAEHPSQSGVLILSVKSFPSTTRLAKLVDKTGITIECKPPAEDLLPDWLIQLAQADGQMKLDSEAAHLMVELVGPEIGLLASEVGKLIVYVGDRRQIRRDDVARMVGSGRIDSIWETLDNATTGNARAAVEDLDHLLTSGEAPVRLLAAMASNLQKIHHAGQLRLARVDLKSACQASGIYGRSVDKTAKQHTHLGPDRVAGLPKLLLETDLDLKGESTLTPRVVLECLMLKLAGPRRD